MADPNQTSLARRFKIRGIENLQPADWAKEIQAGARFVFYEYCISFVIVSVRRPSDIFFLRPGDIGIVRGLPYVLISLLLGWWGVPWGLVYTSLTLLTNLSGGCDVTDQVVEYLDRMRNTSCAGAFRADP